MKNNKYLHILNLHQLLALIIIGIILGACSNKLKADKDKHKFSKPYVEVLENGYYSDPIYEKPPIPAQGEDQFYKDMYMDMRYPSSAKVRGIQGSVLFEIRINKHGEVESIRNVVSVDPSCDDEAKKAIERGCQHGFKPYVYKNQEVAIKYYMPVNFRLR